jgi:hypothetical protein
LPSEKRSYGGHRFWPRVAGAFGGDSGGEQRRSNRHHPFVDEIFNDIFVELQSRLSEPLTDLSEADRVAILTAVMKGAGRGVLSGIAVQTHAVNEAWHDVDVQTWFRGPEGAIGKPDLWAERYGQPAEEE